MDTFEFNKIAGAVLSALLLAFGAGTVQEIFTHGKPTAAKVAYELPAYKGAPGGKAAEPEKPFEFAQIAPLLKTASVDGGQAVFKRCTACHTVDPGGKSGPTGPNLYGIVGREPATSPTFPRYSAALKGEKGSWTYEKLAKYIHDPRVAVPGNQMAFAGVKDNSELADLLAYLRTLSDKPVPLP